MKVVVPFSPNGKMIEAVRIALFHERVKVDYREMTQPTDYYELIKEYWQKGKAFIINEHDVIAFPGALKALEDCQSPWCTYTYRAPCGWLTDGLGLVKFVPEKLRNIFADTFGTTHWGGIDMEIARRLQASGVQQCVHGPAITNLNPRMWFVTT